MPQRKTLLRQKAIIESLISANMSEVELIKSRQRVNWDLIDTYYRSGRVLAAQHMEIMNQLERR